MSTCPLSIIRQSTTITKACFCLELFGKWKYLGCDTGHIFVTSSVFLGADPGLYKYISNIIIVHISKTIYDFFITIFYIFSPLMQYCKKKISLKVNLSEFLRKSSINNKIFQYFTVRPPLNPPLISKAPNIRFCSIGKSCLKSGQLLKRNHDCRFCK